MPAKSPGKNKLKVPPVLFAKTQRVVSAITKETGDTFLTYWSSPNGSVCQSDVEGFYEILQRLGPQKTLYVFLKSGGGDVTASLRIVNLLRRYTEHFVALLPLECASAATMIALGANQIQMGPLAFLTAIDTSLTHDLSPVDPRNHPVSVSQDELNRVINLWRRQWRKDHRDRAVEARSNPYGALFGHVHPLVIGAVDRSSSLSVKLCSEILAFHLKDSRKAQRISVHLNSSYPAHNYPIVQREAQRIGLSVAGLDPRLNDLLLDLHGLYSEMGQEAVTDYDEGHYHNNEIVNIIESVGIQLFYQMDKDWHYRTEERRWDPMHDNSSWRKIEKVGKKTVHSVFHVR